ncbi:DUF4148 domain-containing protein [Variovorax sp. VNK109]|jgi:hypothetical protein|uniref:DUF4148 domain-containing protein n=1 Tax=Variovorax sp. VNK109 TaxID=3400919 RepID=UPI003C065800
MNKTSALIAAVVLSGLAGVAAADEADGSQFALQIQGQRARAEVNAEAVQYARTDRSIPSGSRVTEPVRNGRSREAVHAEAVDYARVDKSIPSASVVAPMVKSGLTRDAVRAQLQVQSQTRG